ncbi:MAG: hypothetical protein WBF43_05260, partial [Methylocella sp.]
TEHLAERHLSHTLKPNQPGDRRSLICPEPGQTLDFPASVTTVSKAITNVLFLGSGGREYAVALATIRTFEAALSPHRSLPR